MDHTAELGFKELLVGLRIALENGATYSLEHSIFLRSLEECKKRLDTILVAFRSVEIMVAPHYLVIDDMKFENDSSYEQLAHFLHIRSIKSIKFERGVEMEELKYFLSKMSLRSRNILEEGGMAHLLQDKHIVHISAGMLDYSDILKSTKEDKDVWAYLLRKAVDAGSQEEMEAIANNFEHMLRSVDTKNLFEAGEFQQAVEDLLDKLQQTNEAAFIECTRALCEALARYLETAGDMVLPERLAGFLRSLNAEDFAGVLLKQLLAADTAQITVFKLYEQLLTPEHHEAIALFLGKKIEARVLPQINLAWLEKISGLLEQSPEKVILTYYAPVILRYRKIFAEEDCFRFDQDKILSHYRAALIGLLAQEDEAEWFDLIIDHILLEWEAVPEEEKKNFYQKLFEIRSFKKKGGSPLEPALQKLDKFVIHYIEGRMLAGQENVELEEFLKLFSEGTMLADAYLSKIFQEEDLRPSILNFFFTFYSSDSAFFYERLNDKLSDTPFLLRLIENLKDSPESSVLGVLKNLFSCPNPYIKTEVFKRMEKLKVYDQDFLMSVLGDKGSGSAIREQALAVLMKDPLAKTAAAEVLLSQAGPFGKNKDLLTENIRMVGRVGLKEAVPFLAGLKKEGFLWWNSKVSTEALRVLEKWNYGKN